MRDIWDIPQIVSVVYKSDTVLLIQLIYFTYMYLLWNFPLPCISTCYVLSSFSMVCGCHFRCMDSYLSKSTFEFVLGPLGEKCEDIWFLLFLSNRHTSVHMHSSWSSPSILYGERLVISGDDITPHLWITALTHHFTSSMLILTAGNLEIMSA